MNWDYTKQAKTYLNRPNYADQAIYQLIEHINANDDWTAADIGAGTGNLSVLLLNYIPHIYAIEPNNAMRSVGEKRTAMVPQIIWMNGTGEETGLPSKSVRLAAFGSSFNTTNRELALKESHRILKDGGWFACMWNHRDLEDELQSKMQKIIYKCFPDYEPGTRREPQADIILESGLFNDVHYIQERRSILATKASYLDAWKSVKTEYWDNDSVKFNFMINKMKEELPTTFTVPYDTIIWVARKKA